ncbi:PTS sugar transporter subunit IIA [Anaerofustis stercorihominis]|uniref:PTS sugar transporter subunit IIA n=1 Tax=Anaerofustis stercorihominis TaxID=214853 RepID=UPI00214AB663|nr:PTS sugar transporter subunit IIA [Anaerofustis stercorihominis]MCR2032937.1 PTS sugar transporter subunit IIA [Anaerofustis stercorihominis]
MDKDINNILSLETIDVRDLQIENKDNLFKTMAGMFYDAGCIKNEIAFIEALYKREKSGSTYMGNGLAVPHGKSDTVVKPSIAFIRFKPFIYDKEDNEEAEIALMLAIPSSTEQKEYIGMLANITRLFLDEEFLVKLKTEKDKNIILNEFKDRYKNI